MNIAMMTNNFRPFIGGVPISIERLSESLRRLGHNVYVFAPEYKMEYADDAYTFRYAAFPIKMGIFIVPNSFDRRIGEAFGRLKIDVVHSHHPVFAGNSARTLARLHDVPLLFTWHTQYEKYLHHIKTWARLEHKAREEDGGFSGKLARAIVKIGREGIVLNWVKRYANSCDAVFAPSPSMKELIAGHGVHRPVKVLPTGLPESFFALDADEAARIRREHLGDKKYLFCTVTRLAEEKNTGFLFKSLLPLKERLGDVFKLLVIGRGPEREGLEAWVNEHGLAENVEFLGGLPNDQLNAYYAAADLFLFSSKTETQGIVLLEAMSGRTPVVALEASGVCDVVRSGVNGLLTDEDPAHFAGAVSRILEDSSFYGVACNNAHETALRNHSDAVAKVAEAAYMGALEARSKKIRHEAVEPVYSVPKAD